MRSTYGQDGIKWPLSVSNMATKHPQKKIYSRSELNKNTMKNSKRQSKYFPYLPNKRTSGHALYTLCIITGTLALVIGTYGVELPETTSFTIEPVKAQEIEATQPEDAFCDLNVVDCEPDGKGVSPQPRYREVTAYNVGDPSQTDASPCIGATGQDLCALIAQGRKIVATNELPFGSKVEINGEVYEVLDRMNSRYQHRYDIAMPVDQKTNAIKWGLKILDVRPI